MGEANLRGLIVSSRRVCWVDSTWRDPEREGRIYICVVGLNLFKEPESKGDACVVTDVACSVIALASDQTGSPLHRLEQDRRRVRLQKVVTGSTFVAWMGNHSSATIYRPKGNKQGDNSSRTNRCQPFHWPLVVSGPLLRFGARAGEPPEAGCTVSAGRGYFPFGIN
jgi:hypothetical protein